MGRPLKLIKELKKVFSLIFNNFDKVKTYDIFSLFISDFK